MRVEYRRLFLKDLKKLKKQPIYNHVHTLAFEALPKATSLQEIANVKTLVGSTNRYRIRLGDYRVGVGVNGDTVEIFRVLHRKEFYRYFP